MKTVLLFFLFFSFISNLLFSQIFLINNSTAVSCECWQQRDSTWSVAAFDASGGSGGPGVPPEYRNDDWSTDTISLPFTFCFYGDPVKKIFINNNGNISIGSPYSTYTPYSFPDPSFRMVAPFWADVDTRDTMSGIVYYKITQQYLIVQWDHVGYFGMHADKTNTFQLIISDGHSNILPEDKNVGFCYHEMQWTTGDASQGINGFGGGPATVGVNYGDGINYLQIGMYDDSTFNYDGPYGNNDGVRSLSNQSFAFNVCVNNFNVSPILSGAYLCDTIHLCIGDTFAYQAKLISPEQNQITTVTTSNNGLTGVNLLTNPGNQATLFLSFIASTAGLFTIDVIGTDDGSPAASTTYPLIFNIENCTNGIIDNTSKENFLLPSAFHSNLIANFSTEIKSIKIYNDVGKLVFENSNASSVNINTANWTNGIYFITIVAIEKVFTKKLLKY